MLKIPFVVSLLILPAVVSAPVYASQAPGGRAEVQACYDEAAWPVTVSPAYVYGGARVREQQRNAFHPSVSAMKGLCRQMAAGGDTVALAADCGDALSRQMEVYGERARDHALRARDICQAMTGQSVKVAGI